MSKAFDTTNLHTQIRKLLQTNIPGTIIKLIANYIKGRKAYTTYKNHTSSFQNWRSTRWRPFTNTIQHIHCRHATTKSTHIHNISVQAHKPPEMIKALTATGWGKQKETLMATYNAVMRPALEYASSIWSWTSINKLQVMQNAALRTATGCSQDTNIQHLHDETLILPIHSKAIKHYL